MMKWCFVFCRKAKNRVILWRSLASYYAYINTFYIFYPHYNFTYVLSTSAYSCDVWCLFVTNITAFITICRNIPLSQFAATSVGTGASTFSVICKRPIQISSITPNILNNVFVVFLSVLLFLHIFKFIIMLSSDTIGVAFLWPTLMHHPVYTSSHVNYGSKLFLCEKCDLINCGQQILVIILCVSENAQ
jgi:hypothetical protein